MIESKGIGIKRQLNERALWKRGLTFLLIMVLIQVSLGSWQASYGADRPPHVIYEVEWTSDITASLTLKWSDPTITDPIMISSYKVIDNEMIEVRYTIDETAREGFDQRTIRVSDMTFPCVIRLKENAPDVADAEFSDLGVDEERNTAIKHLYDLGIIEGYADGTFRPNGNVTRAEFSKMLFYSAKMTYNLDSELVFYDVGTWHWANDYVYTLAANKIVEGKGEGRFDPDGTIKFSEVLTILDRTFNVYYAGGDYNHELSEHWSNTHFLGLVEAGIVAPADVFYYPYTPERPATREECALLLSRILSQYHDVTKVTE
jgi:hypothetical protein